MLSPWPFACGLLGPLFHGGWARGAQRSRPSAPAPPAASLSFPLSEEGCEANKSSVVCSASSKHLLEARQTWGPGSMELYTLKGALSHEEASVFTSPVLCLILWSTVGDTE